MNVKPVGDSKIWYYENLIFSILIGTSLFGWKSETTNKQRNQKGKSNLTPLKVVNKRMGFYNQHNFAEFILLYTDDIKVYTYPDKLLGTGSDNISSIFKSKFAQKSIQVENMKTSFILNDIL